MHVECGYILRHDGSEENTLYLVNGMLFEEVEDPENEDDDIEQWGDGKYYKRFLLGSEKKLKTKLKKCRKNLVKWRQKAKNISKRLLSEKTYRYYCIKNTIF